VVGRRPLGTPSGPGLASSGHHHQVGREATDRFDDGLAGDGVGGDERSRTDAPAVDIRRYQPEETALDLLLTAQFEAEVARLRDVRQHHVPAARNHSVGLRDGQIAGGREVAVSWSGIAKSAFALSAPGKKCARRPSSRATCGPGRYFMARAIGDRYSGCSS